MAILRDFSLKYIDIMIGVILGVGFQWWPDLREPWQYLAFIFIYLNLVDYWVDYSPTVKKFPLKNEIDVVLHTFIFFTMFLLIYYAKTTITLFFVSFILYRIGDLFWIYRMKKDYSPNPANLLFMNTWQFFNCIEIALTLLLIASNRLLFISPLVLIIVFIIGRTTTRILASLRYHNVYYG